MQTSIAIYDQNPGGGKQPAVTLQLVSSTITVRELIRERVFAEVKAYNEKSPEYFRGLVQPTDAEAVLNGYKLKKRRQLSWENQYKCAVSAFKNNGFLILVDDRQVDDLEDKIVITNQTRVGFIKLTPLVGG